MSTVRPFPARIVGQDWAARAVTALSELEETEAAPDRDPIDPAAYEESAAAVYVYRQQRGGVAHSGVVCDVSVEAFVDGRVRGHEAVQARRVETLLRHHATTADPPGPVALLHHPGPAFTRTLDATAGTLPILDFPGPADLQQTVWRVPAGAATDRLVQELDSATLYIADGHHRVAAALEAWRRAGRPADAGLLCVVHAMDALQLSAFHRRVTGPVDQRALLDLLSSGFDDSAAPERPDPSVGSFGLYVGGDWFQVSRRAGDGATGLDVEILQARVLEPLGSAVEIAPARTSVDELTRRCDTDGGALFTLAPPSLQVLTELADAGEVMPPKTTYFVPKPCTGIFLPY